MSVKKKFLFFALGVFVLIQFSKPAKNQTSESNPNDIFAHYETADSLQLILKTSCYDCHSNNTTYPWYANIQPVAWWLNSHVEEGKRKINFSEFATYPVKRADHKLEEVIEMIEEEEMPLKSYTILHSNANLNASQKEAIIVWAKNIRSRIITK